MAFIECYNTVVYPHQFRLTHDLSMESFGGSSLDNDESEGGRTGFSEDEMNITELSNMHISHKANTALTEQGGVFNSMYLKQTESLHTLMSQNHTQTDDVSSIKDDVIGQYSNTSFEPSEIPQSPSRMINKKNKYNKQKRYRRKLPEIPVCSGPALTSTNERVLSGGDLSLGRTSESGGAGCGAAAAQTPESQSPSGAGQSLADELLEADPGIKLHHVDSNDRIAVINIVYNDPNEGEEGEENALSGGASGREMSHSWSSDGGDSTPLARSLTSAEGDGDEAPSSPRASASSPPTSTSSTPFTFLEDSQYIDDSPQVFKPKYSDEPYRHAESEEDMETSTHSSTSGTGGARCKEPECAPPAATTAPPAGGDPTHRHPAYPAGRDPSHPAYPAGQDPTHRGCHKFIPRHKDEIFIEIGDPIHVRHEADDLWCEGVNLRTGQCGVFPSAYATDLSFLAVQDEGGTHSMRFFLQFLGSIEVTGNRGTDVLQQAINKVAFQCRSRFNKAPPAQVLVEINEYGVRMTDAHEGHKKAESWEKLTAKQRLVQALQQQKDSAASSQHNHFFPLKNVSFCGFHPRNERYFAFITKHPVENKFACHVFLGEGSTQCVAEAVGVAFRRFYQQYMAFVHPTEDIYMED